MEDSVVSRHQAWLGGAEGPNDKLPNTFGCIVIGRRILLRDHIQTVAVGWRVPRAEFGLPEVRCALLPLRGLPAACVRAADVEHDVAERVVRVTDALVDVRKIEPAALHGHAAASLYVLDARPVQFEFLVSVGGVAGPVPKSGVAHRSSVVYELQHGGQHDVSMGAHHLCRSARLYGRPWRLGVAGGLGGGNLGFLAPRNPNSYGKSIPYHPYGKIIPPIKLP